MMMIRMAIPTELTTDIGMLIDLTNAQASAYGRANSRMMPICIHSAIKPTTKAVVQPIS